MATTANEIIEKARRILALEAKLLALRTDIGQLKKLHDHIKNVNGAYVNLKEVSSNNEFTRNILLLGICEMIEQSRKEAEKIENEILKQ